MKNDKQALIDEALDTSKEDREPPTNMTKGPSAPLPPRTPNYGKTPKYIERYKEEAKQRELTKEEERAAKHRPIGTRILPEAERIKTLEDL